MESNPNRMDLSYSMVVDDIDEMDEIDTFTLVPKEVNAVERRKIHQWVQDDSTSTCYSCKTQFGYLVRKHHCRCCGRIFCYYCSNYFVDKTKLKFVDVPVEPKKCILETFTSHSTTVRVCKSCYDMINDINDIIIFYHIFQYLDIKTIKTKCVHLSRRWYKASKFYLASFRELQYRLPFKKFMQNEKNMLANNITYMHCHNNWIYQYIMAFGNNKLYYKNILKLLNNNKKTSKCWNLMCSRTCNQTLSIYQALNIISSIPTISDEIVLRLMDIIKNLENIQDYYVLFVNRLIEEYINFEKKYGQYKCIIFDFIFESIHRDANKSYEFIIALDTMKLSDIDTRCTVIKMVRQKFIADLNIVNPSVHHNVMKTYGLHEALKEPDPLKQLTIYVNTSRQTPYPFDMNFLITKIVSENIGIKISKCKPIEIPFSNGHGQINSILYKKEDMRHDYLICKIIKIMMGIIKQEICNDVDIITYSVIPLNDKSGIIEIIQDAETINTILARGCTILNYILENNPNQNASFIRNKFIKSTAAYCVITYMLGIEDRHMDNIMIHKSGQLFHVDYGYILGHDPKMPSYMRITPSMLDAIGGYGSKSYKEFEEACTKIYNAIRENVSFFSTVLLQLHNINSKTYSIETIEMEVIKRFEPGINQSDAGCHLSHLMEKSRSSDWKYSILDYLHGTIKTMCI